MGIIVSMSPNENLCLSSKMLLSLNSSAKDFKQGILRLKT